jgi:hypothetical protein
MSTPGSKEVPGMALLDGGWWMVLDTVLETGEADGARL